LIEKRTFFFKKKVFWFDFIFLFYFYFPAFASILIQFCYYLSTQESEIAKKNIHPWRNELNFIQKKKKKIES